MSSQALLQSLKESILTQANVKAVYGETIAAEGKTVVPVEASFMGMGLEPAREASATLVLGARVAVVGEEREPFRSVLSK